MEKKEKVITRRLIYCLTMSGEGEKDGSCPFKREKKDLNEGLAWGGINSRKVTWGRKQGRKQDG